MIYFKQEVSILWLMKTFHQCVQITFHHKCTYQREKYLPFMKA